MAPKRKDGPGGGSQGRNVKKQKTWDARTIRSQTSDAAFGDGELDVHKFVKAREFEIKALEDGMRKAKHGLSTRAHQELPKELRRRTASHNVKRVPKRLRERAKKEMAEDNTPTVTSRRRKPSGHQRLRLETAQRLQAISKKNKERRQAKKAAKASDDIQVLPEGAEPSTTSAAPEEAEKQGVRTKKPKIKTPRLRNPPIPPAKFRKRQIHKTWLPTHLWHSKRARMTPPKEPMWRFALPLTPNIKSYRNAHRASADKGAIAWDTSYMSTIGLEGVEESLTGLLKALGVDHWGQSGTKWRLGIRSWEGWLHERDAPHSWIAPVTVLWNPIVSGPKPNGPDKLKKEKRKAFIRVHPSAFLQLWEQVLRLAKVQKPALTVEDLRFEMGSIEITGPDASEALVGVLRPLGDLDPTNGSLTATEMLWMKIARTPPASLPANAVLAMSISDPRLRSPPRSLSKDELHGNDQMLIQMLANWPLDRSPHPAAIFEHKARIKAKRNLPTQKAINRRQGQADPGEFPKVLESDPPIPLLAFASRKGAETSGTWTIMLPWDCVLAVWKSLVYYPLSTGGTIRFGGVNEQRQLAYENEKPWFPADFPASRAGQQWEYDESNRRKAILDRKPKSRKINYDSIDLGNGQKGEIGIGWECDWQQLVREQRPASREDATMTDASHIEASTADATNLESTKPNKLQESVNPVQKLHHVPQAKALRATSYQANITLPDNALATVKITMLSRGRPSDCARVYRLPVDNRELRQKWLAQQPTAKSARTNNKKAKMPPRPNANAPDATKRSWLAAAILMEPPEPGHQDYPVVPDECDLIGFVTTGNFSLKEGKGVGIGSILVQRVLPGDDSWAFGHDRKPMLDKQHQLCIVRDSGQTHGRLARWEFV